MATKKDLQQYITTVGTIKPSAEVKFRSKNEQGQVIETVASRTYVSNHIDKEVQAVKNIAGLSERLNRVTENAMKNAVQSEPDLDELEQEIADDIALSENFEVRLQDTDDLEDDAGSPLTHVPNSVTNITSTEEMSEMALLIKLVSKLIDKIDSMQNFNPVIHVPAPIIHVTLPETKRTVTRAVERDDEGFIKSIREHVEEAPAGEPLIEVQQDQNRKRIKPKKDNE